MRKVNTVVLTDIGRCVQSLRVILTKQSDRESNREHKDSVEITDYWAHRMKMNLDNLNGWQRD
jgi:hypothetical protein